MTAFMQGRKAGGQANPTDQQARQPQGKGPALLGPNHPAQDDREQVAGQAQGSGAITQLVETGKRIALQ